MQVMNHQIQPNQIWRHYKNKDYRIIAISLHTEDLTWYVVYEALYDNEVSKIWHRPLDMFLDSVKVDGKIISRFRHLEQETILQQANESYAQIKEDPQQWREYQEELSIWDSTLEDGLKHREK